MADDRRRKPGLTDDELAAEQGAELPDREVMSTITIGIPFDDIDNLNLALPINQAIANNINTNYSVAKADQIVVIDQGIEEPPVDRVEHPDSDDGGSDR